jgi:GGDEF domain-containing protein
LLDLSQRDERPAYLVYLLLDRAGAVKAPGAVGDEALFGDSLLRQVGNFMRDLFPGYGVYEVLGRLSTGEFAALTPDTQYASRGAVLRRAHQLEDDGAACGAKLRVGVAQFDPACPVVIDELLHDAVQAVNAPQPLSRIASSGLPPHPGGRFANGLEATGVSSRM